MKIVIAGAGEVGSHLAKMLSSEYHEITVVDSDPKRLESIAGMADVIVIEGDCTTFAVLKKHLDGGRTQEQVLTLKAEAEWDLLQENISRFGWTQEPDMHPTTAHVLRAMGGWQAACSWETSKLEWRHKDFVERWQQADGNLELMQGGALAIEAHIKRRLALKSVDEAMGLPKGNTPAPEELRTQWEQLLAEEQRLQQGLAMAQAGR